MLFAQTNLMVYNVNVNVDVDANGDGDGEISSESNGTSAIDQVRDFKWLSRRHHHHRPFILASGSG